MQEQEKSDTSPNDLVVVGSSAGGIEALSILVSTLPENLPAPVVLAQHLDPTRTSNLDQILQKHTIFPVEAIKSSVDLQVGRIYILPTKHHVSVKGHRIEVKAASLKE